jgi:putative addiction module component (TIGR02574 family)
MALTLEQLKEAAAALPDGERAELAEFLLESLGPEDNGSEEDFDRELGRRMEEMRSGKAKGIPGEEVLARLRELYP